jgi:hypothetical protein
MFVAGEFLFHNVVRLTAPTSSSRNIAALSYDYDPGSGTTHAVAGPSMLLAVEHVLAAAVEAECSGEKGCEDR